MSAPEQDWQAAVDLLAAATDVVLVCHVSPDGDALGSAVGLGAALRRRGASVAVSWGSEPFEVHTAYAGLPALDLLVPPAALPTAPALLVTLDTGSVDRLGALAGLVGTAAQVLVLDHHASNTRYGTTNLVDTEAAATAVVVAGLLDRLGVALDAEVAACLYTGLVTDTGSFRYAATTPSVHDLAARLLATGIRHDLISRDIWDNASFSYVQLLGEVCAQAHLEPAAVGGLGLVWTSVSAQDLARHELGLADVEGVIDVVRTAREAEVAAVVKGDPADGLLKVSTRSRGRVDVGAVCTALGGGGHRFAAGFTSYEPLDATVEALRDALADVPHLEP